MNCTKHKLVGKGGCMKGKVTQVSCQRVANNYRKTSAGYIVALCDKCDASFGDIVGTRVAANS